MGRRLRYRRAVKIAWEKKGKGKQPCPSDSAIASLYIAEKKREIIPHPSVNRRTLSGTAALAICSQNWLLYLDHTTTKQLTNLLRFFTFI